jgi:hypothetical protein
MLAQSEVVMADAFIEGLKSEVARLQSLLEALESGKFRIGDTPDGRTPIDRTQAQIIDLKRIIGELQAVIERG